jgi:4-hydroxy-tetrahydrodipicolinate synthase
MARAAELIHAVPEGFACYAGDDNITFAYMALGGHGSISVAANVVPKLFSEMCGLVLKGNLLEARALNAKLIPLYKALSTEINPIPIKYILSKMGWMENKLRLPLIAIDEKKAAAIDSLIGGILPV